ncbi:MAG: aminopeptidase P family protein, partial [Campylobacterales bacterium]|nr:aminopeptidase P family protein [Campylobacterales bacterium]
NTILKKNSLKNIKFDPKEWSLHAHQLLIKNLDTVFISKIDLSQKKRIIKGEDEQRLLAKAASLGAKAFDKFAKKLEKNIGKDERFLTDLAKNILSKRGKYDLSFDPIVALNHNAANPHAKPSDKRLQKKDILLFDGGLKYKRYCSDRTRTAYIDDVVHFNLKQKIQNKKIQKIYDIVRKAHDRAIEKARSGMKASQIDALARDVIEKAGYGNYFMHSTGHGVGLDIHEMPYISNRSNTIIEDGMVFTIEPGIYLEDKFGIRIEDTVVMKNSKALVL